MNPLIVPAVRAATAGLCALFLTACGGGSDPATALPSLVAQSTATLEPEAAHQDVRRQALGTPLNADGPATTLTVRAHGRLAGNVGPVMQVWVDGVLIRTVEVRATEPTDYRFTVPALHTGSRVDLAYVNDGVANGVDRNLWVAFLLAGNTHVLPTTPAVTMDRGVGAAAFDGVDVSPGQAGMWSNGAMRVRWPDPNMTEPITVRASGTLAGGVGPIMDLRVDGTVIGSVEVRSATPTDYTFGMFLPLRPDSRVDIVFNNDAVIAGEDRNLQVAYAISANTFVLPNSTHATYDRGAGPAAFDGVDVVPGKPAVHSNGALRLRWPEPNLTDRLLVRAKGSLAADVGPLMQVHVNGVVVATTEVRNVDWHDYPIAIPPLGPGDKVDLAFINDAVVNGQDRNLHLAYAVSGNTVMLPNSTGVLIDRGKGTNAFDGVDVIPGQASLPWNGALRMVWPHPNITDIVTLRASASLAGNVGPIIQVRVDGVLVSTLEVRATTPTDHAVPVPALRPGSKIDLVYTNDAVVNGDDRNLIVAYLMAGNTRVLPTMVGVVYDLGSGNEAFDGQNVQPGQSGLWSNGAMRLTWPAPNITDSLIIRASSTLAGNVGAIMQLRVDGVILGSAEVRSTQATDFHFAVPTLIAGSKIEVVYANDALIAGQDRNLYIQHLKAGAQTLIPNAPYAVFDGGIGEAAFDWVGVTAGTGAMNSNGALRFTMPATPAAEPNQAARHAASRFLQQASFGPTPADIDRLASVPYTTWLTEQMAMPAAPNYVNHIQGKYNLGADYRPGGSKFTTDWIGQRFWANAATGQDQLRT